MQMYRTHLANEHIKHRKFKSTLSLCIALTMTPCIGDNRTSRSRPFLTDNNDGSRFVLCMLVNEHAHNARTSRCSLKTHNSNVVHGQRSLLELFCDRLTENFCRGTQKNVSKSTFFCLLLLTFAIDLHSRI